MYLPEQIRKLGSEVPRPDLPPLIEQLSERELEVTAAVARGLTNKTIAASLGLSVETVNRPGVVA